MVTTVPRRSTKLITSIVGAAVLLAGCSAANGTGKTDPAGTGTGAPATISADSDAGLKTGIQLKAALLTRSDLPAGFKVVKAVTASSGKILDPTYAPHTMTATSCNKLSLNIWINGAGIDSASFAQTGFTDTHRTQVDGNIDGFRGDDAQRVMTNLRTLFTLCASYTRGLGVRAVDVKLVSRAGPKVGDDSVEARLTASLWRGDTTLVAVRAGKFVVTVLCASGQKDSRAKATKYARLMVKRLMAKPLTAKQLAAKQLTAKRLKAKRPKTKRPRTSG